MLNSINTNIASYFAQKNIGNANSAVSSAVGRLSSGNRIVRASDDVAAMSVGTSLRATVSTLKMGKLNASQGTSMLQVADGALAQIQDMLLRQKALSTQATSGTLTGSERGFLDQEFQNLTLEVNRLVENTNFNGVKLLDGTLGGTTTSLAGTNQVAVTFTGAAGTVAASTVAIQAFDSATGLSVHGNGAGQLRLVDSGGTAITNAGFLSVDQGVIGKVGKVQFSNLVEGVAATVSVEINGISFTGTAVHDATANAGTFTVSNGNTYIEIGYAANGMNLASNVSATTSFAAVNTALKDVSFMQTRQVDGVDFLGTALEGVSFAANAGTPMIRTAVAGDVSISNFQYVSNSGAANTNTLSVQINGETWYSTAVNDTLAPADSLVFTNGKQEALQITLTGLPTTPPPIGNIRTSETDKQALINALNQGFSGLNKGVDFALGTEASDKLTVSIGRSNTDALFNGEGLSITTMDGAIRAGEVLNDAIDLVTTIRANVGAMMSRFDFASSNIEIAIQNQDAARGTLLDTDIAEESSNYATYQVQLQAGISVLAQANQLPQNLLKLLG